MGELFTRASDQRQYDRDDVEWSAERISFASPTSVHFWEYLSSCSPSWLGKDLVDIGSGSGWLLDQAKQAGARHVVGIEPSRKNVELARRQYPHITTVLASLEEYSPSQNFDIAVAVMSLVHIGDLQEAFKKTHNLLNPRGEFQAIVPDFDYFRRPRHDYEVSFEDIDADEYATMVKRPFGTLADIVRSIDRYRAVGNETGLRLVEDVPMPPTEKLMQTVPRYRGSAGKPMTHLLRFIVEK